MIVAKPVDEQLQNNRQQRVPALPGKGSMSFSNSDSFNTPADHIDSPLSQGLIKSTCSH